MRHKLTKAFTTMAVAGLLLTGCGDQGKPAPDNAPEPQAEVDLTGFIDMNPVQDNLVYHDWYAYNGSDGKARRASLTIQEIANGGYTEQLAKKQFMSILAEQNGGEEVSEAEYQKEWKALLKRQADSTVYFATDFIVEKLDDGIEEDEPRAWDGDERLFFLVPQQCKEPSVHEIPFEDGCLIGKSAGLSTDGSYRDENIAWADRDSSPWESGSSDVKTEMVSGTGGGVSFDATGAEQEAIRNAKQIFVAYDLEEGGEPIGAVPNFTCEPGSAGQAILDAYKAESDANGGIAKRYLSFAPKDSGCTMQPVAAEATAQ